MNASVMTLGCKINQCESESLCGVLTARGYAIVPVGAEADLVVVNTCAVTAEAERKSRQTVRRIAKTHPSARIVVVGCSAQAHGALYEALPNVAAVGGTYDKYRLLTDYLDGLPASEPYVCGTSYVEYPPQARTRTREYVKVQDGCNRFCSYCIVPYLRGRSRSRSPENILAQVEASTAHEIVITGIDLSAYGLDIGTTLVDLLARLPHPRIRLGSLEPTVVTERFVDVVSADNFCKHFHLSMQSGSDAVLAAMNRHYSAELFLQKVALLKSRFPYANITADVIAGFPGETEADHAETLRVVREAGFGDLHVFPYSERKGTAAADRPQLDKAVRNARAHEIAAVGAQTRAAYLATQIGRPCTVLTEQRENGRTVGYSETYCKIALPSGTPLDALVSAVPRGVYGEGLEG